MSSNLRLSWVWWPMPYSLSLEEDGGRRIGVQGQLWLYIKFEVSLGCRRPYLKEGAGNKPNQTNKQPTPNHKLLYFK